VLKADAKCGIGKPLTSDGHVGRDDTAGIGGDWLQRSIHFGIDGCDLRFPKSLESYIITERVGEVIPLQLHVLQLVFGSEEVSCCVPNTK
jgi:hypothetical protein